MAEVPANIDRVTSGQDERRPGVIQEGSSTTFSSGPRQLKDFESLSSDSFWEMDESLTYTYVSDRFSEITGIPESIVLGMSNDELELTPDDRDGEFRTLLNEHKPFRNVILSYLHPDGRDIDILANGDVIHDVAGNFLGYRGTARQISDRSNVVELKQESKAFHQLAGRIANIGLWEWDEVAKKCVFCSAELADIHGVSAEEYLQRCQTNDEARLWMYPDDRSRYEAAREVLRKDHLGFEIEYRLARADGTVAEVYEVVAPIVDQNGTLIRSFGFVKDISNRKRMAGELKNIAQKHRQTESLAKIGHWEWDEAADRCISCSEEMARMHGLSVKEYLAQTDTFEGDLAFVHPDDRARYERLNDDYMLRPARTEIEYRLLAGGDKIRDVREVAEPVFDDENQHIRTVGFIQDVTDSNTAAASLEQARNELEIRVRTRTEELQHINDELLESQSRLQDAIRIAKLGYFKWDTTEHRGIFFDDEYAKILGVATSECMTESLDAYMTRVHPDDVDRVAASYRDGDAHKAPIDVEYRIIQSSGESRYVHERSRPKLDENSVVIRRFGTVQDITERMLATQKFAEIQKRVNELSANAREVLYVLSADWQQVLYVNEAYEDIWGYSRQKVIDNPGMWVDSLHPDDREMIVTEIREKLSGSDSSPDFSDCRIIGPSGEVRWISNHMFPVRNDEGDIVRYTGVAEDITERKEATDALHQVQKMEAVGQLTGGVAHDFNNLLAVILGNSGLLQGRVGEDDEILLQDIIIAGTRGAELTKRLLAFSRLQPLQSAPTDVAKLAYGMESLLQRTLGATISIEITSLCSDPIVHVDSALLENAILNLSLNARDAMPDGGRLTIQVNSADPHKPARPATQDAGSDRTLEIVVEDDGIGMDTDVLSRSLEPFFTTKKSGEGSGLGLPMVYGFVKQSNGDMVINSKPGSGTAVTIFLPCIDDKRD